MRKSLVYVAVAMAASAVTLAVMATAGVASRSDTTGHTRTVYVRTGDFVSFQGLAWTCNLNRAPDPIGVLSGPSVWRQRLFCRYQVDDGGCPFLLMANPYMAFGVAKGAGAPRQTRTGLFWMRTHYGCD